MCSCDSPLFQWKVCVLLPLLSLLDICPQDPQRSSSSVLLLPSLFILLCSLNLEQSLNLKAQRKHVFPSVPDYLNVIGVMHSMVVVSAK